MKHAIILITIQNAPRYACIFLIVLTKWNSIYYFIKLCYNSLTINKHFAYFYCFGVCYMILKSTKTIFHNVALP